jgi:hypothetical protein
MTRLGKVRLGCMGQVGQGRAGIASA